MSDAKRTIKPGWQGRYYEDFDLGDVYRSRFGRTVSEMDNLLFTHLTLNTNPLHFDANFAGKSKWGKPLVNSTFTLALVTGMTVPDISENAMANLGWEQIKLTNPVFIGDTLYAETEVLDKRESKSYPDAGIVKVRTRGINQDGKVVLSSVRTFMVYKRDGDPGKDIFPEIQE